MRPINCLPKKTPAIYNIVKNDLPISEEYLEMDSDDLLDAITDGKIGLVSIVYFEAGYTVWYPGKKAVSHRGKDWHYFFHTLKRLGDDARRDGFPVHVMGIWSCSNTPRCKWCGAVVERPVGKTIPFCADTDCRKKYLKFRDLLKKLVKEGKISEFERDCRMKTHCVLEDTLFGSRYLLDTLRYESEELGHDIPPISTKFIVTEDLDIEFADKTCERCGAAFAGNKQARFCSDTCRYRYHNDKKKN